MGKCTSEKNKKSKYLLNVIVRIILKVLRELYIRFNKKYYEKNRRKY
jgi:hypothetical protein